MGLNSDPTCPPLGGINVGVPIAGNLTLQHIMLIAAGIWTAITLGLSFSLILKHLHRYTVPDEQRPIIRVVFTPVVFAIFNLLSIAFYDAAIYLTPVADLYEALALASVLLLFVHYVTPDTTQREAFFTKTGKRSRKGRLYPGGSLGWFKYIWIVVLLYPLVKLVLFTAQEASQATGTYCNTSNNVHFEHIWITVFSAITVILAVTAILRFYRRFKSDMTHHKPLSKLVSFKVIVFTNFIQTLVFGFLNSDGHLNGNSKVTHLDLWLGIPSLLSCFEQVFFAAFFHYSYGSREYGSANLGNTQRMSLLSAATDALNPADLLVGIVSAFRLLASVLGGHSRRNGSETFMPITPPGIRQPQAGHDGYDKTYNARAPRNGELQPAPCYQQAPPFQHVPRNERQ